MDPKKDTTNTEKKETGKIDLKMAKNGTPKKIQTCNLYKLSTIFPSKIAIFTNVPQIFRPKNGPRKRHQNIPKIDPPKKDPRIDFKKMMPKDAQKRCQKKTGEICPQKMDP